MNPNPLTRRRFLVAGGVVGAALAAGSALLMRGGGDAHYASLLPGATPRVLSRKELGVLAAFCDRACPPEGEDDPGPRKTRVAERIDKELTFHTPKMQADVKAALLLLEHGGVLHLQSTRFTRLPADEQDAYLTRMGIDGNALERQVFANLKLLAIFFHYCDERTWKGIHYEGPFAARKAPAADSRVS
ncbi:MAG: gluconate 2-dehydrogenase subunit 3 family protein [Archangium sp.]|nr:gluconate 2-dehydrogenase subunit 3 family protein [Archangium sp.]